MNKYNEEKERQRGESRKKEQVVITRSINECTNGEIVIHIV